MPTRIPYSTDAHAERLHPNHDIINRRNRKHIEVRIKTLRLYLDTSVIRGCDDPEYQPWSLSLLQDFRTGLYKPVISELVREEAADGAIASSRCFAELLECDPKIVPVTERAQTLADLYLERGILTEASRNDALHVAIATLEEVDVLVSWNYANILHLNKVRQFITVHLELGLKPIQIRSPRVVASYELGAQGAQA